MREIRRAAKVLEVIDSAPVPVHVLHLDGGALRDERIQKMRHIERVEVGTRAQLAQDFLEPREARTAHLQHPDPASVRGSDGNAGLSLMLAGGPVRRVHGAEYALEQHRRAEQPAIVAPRAVGEITYGAIVLTRR